MAALTVPITLVLAGGLAFINLWLAIRTSRVRHSEGVSIGDGGNDRLIRRMRAQANFVENAPFVLALVGLIEFSTGSSLWLWLASTAFLIARLVHALGMDGGRLARGRDIGTGVTMLLLLGLGAWAIILPYRVDFGRRQAPPTQVEVVPSQG